MGTVLHVHTISNTQKPWDWDLCIRAGQGAGRPACWVQEDPLWAPICTRLHCWRAHCNKHKQYLINLSPILFHYIAPLGALSSTTPLVLLEYLSLVSDFSIFLLLEYRLLLSSNLLSLPCVFEITPSNPFFATPHYQAQIIGIHFHQNYRSYFM